MRSTKIDRLKQLVSILSQEYNLGLSDQSVELGLDNYLKNNFIDIQWIFSTYPIQNRSYKNLGIGERHIWIKNLISKITYEIKISEAKISRELILKNLPLETPIDQVPFINKRFTSKFSNIGVYNLKDLILHFPFRYEDYTNIKKVNLLSENQNATVIGKITKKHVNFDFCAIGQLGGAGMAQNTPTGSGNIFHTRQTHFGKNIF